MFAHSYMCLLPPSLTPCLSFPPSVFASAHTLTHPLSLTPALPIAHVLWQILLACQKGRMQRASLRKAALASRSSGLLLSQTQYNPRRKKLKDEAMLWSSSEYMGQPLHQGKLQILQPLRKATCPPPNKPLHRH